MLNNTPAQVIPEETRRRVLEAAAELAYAPSAEARALSRGRTDVVLLYLPQELPMREDVAAIMEHLSTGLGNRGLTLVIHPSTGRPLVDVWAAVTPTAVLAWDLDDQAVDALRRGGVRVVASLTGSDAIGRWVTGDRELEIARLQVQRLITAGHRQLAFAAPSDAHLAAAGRLRGWALQRACAAAALPDPVVFHVPPEPDAAAAAVALLRSEHGAVTGICAHDATVALAVLSGMRGIGLRSPTGYAVIGVNDTTAAALADPPLTMVRVHADVTAMFLVDTIAAMLVGGDVPPAPAGIASLVERLSV